MQVDLLVDVGQFTISGPPTQSLTSTAHGVTEGDTINVVSDNTLPAPLNSDTAGTTYYAMNVATNTFEITYTAAGDAISRTGVTADASTDTLTYLNHGFVNDDRVTVASSGTQPAGLSLNTHYYVINAGQDTFQVSTTSGGGAVNITSAGTGNHTFATGIAVTMTDAGTGTHSYSAGVPISIAETPELRKYVLTYVAKYGEVEMESAPSLPSVDTVSWRSGQRVILTSMPTGPGTGDFNIIKKRIYRTNTSLTSAEYQFVAEVDLAQTTFIDEIPDTDLGDVITSEDYDMPPYDMVGIKPMANGILVAFRDNEICFSEPYKPHAWPIAYRLSTVDPIVGIGVYGIMSLQPFSFAVILTEKFPYSVRGQTPDTMIMDQIELPYPCVSRRSIVDMGKLGVAYASIDGICVASAQGIDLITGTNDGWIITPEQWRNKNPKTMLCTRWDHYYMGWYEQEDGTIEGFMFDFLNGDLTHVDLFATAAHLNPISGNLYVVGPDQDATPSEAQARFWDFFDFGQLTATWKDKRRFMPVKQSMTAARIDSEAYGSFTPLLVVDADDTERVNQVAPSGDIFRINTGQLANTFELEVQTTEVVRSIEMGTSVRQLLGE